MKLTVGYFSGYEKFSNFKLTSWNYKILNHTVNETKWVIDLFKLFF